MEQQKKETKQINNKNNNECIKHWIHGAISHHMSFLMLQLASSRTAIVDSWQQPAPKPPPHVPDSSSCPKHSSSEPCGPERTENLPDCPVPQQQGRTIAALASPPFITEHDLMWYQIPLWLVLRQLSWLSRPRSWLWKLTYLGWPSILLLFKMLISTILIKKLK